MVSENGTLGHQFRQRENYAGTIFKTDADGNNDTVVFQMGIVPGAAPLFMTLCPATNGKLYGTTIGDGDYNGGVIFEFDTFSGSYTVKHHFETNSGTNPYAGLAAASNGKLYGVTNSGGANNIGTIFEFDPVKAVFRKVFDFVDTMGYSCYGGLSPAGNGKLYGGTLSGGKLGAGVLFEWDPALDSFRKTHDFNGIDGAALFGGITKGTDGLFYGVTIGGGVRGNGVVFTYNILNDSFSKKTDIHDSICSGFYGRMEQAGNGNFYGMSYGGGSGNMGALYEYDTATQIVKRKKSFNGSSNGRNSYGHPVMASNGNLYGMTYQGGAYDKGVLIEYNVNSDSLAVKNEFNGSNGSYPMGSLIQPGKGKLFGVTQSGNTSPGTIFSYDISQDTLETLWRFREYLGGRSRSALLQLSNGKMYGMTETGGSNSKGTLFEYDPLDGSYMKRVDFNGSNGDYPAGNTLMQAGNGKIYGMTRKGGLYDLGVLFEYDPKTRVYTKKINFNDSNGSWPSGILVDAGNGKLIGTTRGTYGRSGTIFEYDIAGNTILTLFRFTGGSVGSTPSRIMKARSGKYYGLSFNYGSSGCQIFEFDPADTSVTIKTRFSYSNYDYENTNSHLIQTENNKFYGLSNSGGQYYSGMIYEFDPDSSDISVKYSFNYQNNIGYAPYGGLLQSPNGKLYGTCRSGGKYYFGTMFEYDPGIDSFSKKFDFNDTNGSEPFVTLTRVCYPNTGTDSIVACEQYKWIDGITYTGNNKSATYTIPNYSGCDSVVTLHLIILKSSRDTLYPVVCNGYRSAGGIFHTSSGIYNDTLVNHVGCDSIITQYVTILTSSRDTISPFACKRYRSPSGQQIWNSSGTYMDTLVNRAGCDSIILIHLVINTVDTTVINNDPVLRATAGNGDFRWLDCSNAYAVIPGADSSVFTPLFNGIYAVEITQNGCIDTSACYTVSKLDISDPAVSNRLRLYPNPAENAITLELPGPEFTIKVYNSDGRLIMQVITEGINTTMSVAHLPAGLYEIYAVKDSLVRRVRFVKL